MLLIPINIKEINGRKDIPLLAILLELSSISITRCPGHLGSQERVIGRYLMLI